MAGLNRPKRIQGKQSPSHARAPQQESAAARRVGGRTTAGSGCGGEKGDVRKARCVRIECKTTSNKSFSVTRDLIAKIEAAAMPNGEIPVIEVEFNERGRRVASVCVIPSWVLDIVGGGEGGV